MVTIFITPTVVSVNGLWLLTSGLSGHSGEHHKEGTHFADTQDRSSRIMTMFKAERREKAALSRSVLSYQESKNFSETPGRLLESVG